MKLADPGTAERVPVDHGSPDSSPSEETSVDWSSGDVRLLRRRLKKHRKILARGWSDDTIYPGFRTTKTPGQPASHGQCGVTSAWLLAKLGEPWGSEAHYCFGDVLFGSAGGDLSVEKYHCWVEIGAKSSANRLVVDLTCDQFKPLKRVQVLIEDLDSLMNRSIEYRATTWRRFDELDGDSVWARLKLLDQATSQIRPKMLLRLPRRINLFALYRSRRDQGDIDGAVDAQSTEVHAA